MTKQQLNARFWVYINGDFAKLTLRPGQELSHGRSWRHDEGWSSCFATWSFDGLLVTEDSGTDGTDCDGRLSTQDERSCPITQLHSSVTTHLVCAECGNQADTWDQNGRVECSRIEHKGLKLIQEPNLPDWQPGKRSQRDYTAESMGY